MKYRIKILNPTIGVPVSYLNIHNPKQFEIYGATESEGIGLSNGLWKNGSSQACVNGRKVFKRIFIRRKIDDEKQTEERSS